jgi:hypothetical protein
VPTTTGGTVIRTTILGSKPSNSLPSKKKLYRMKVTLWTADIFLKALEAMSLLKASRETFISKSQKRGFILSKRWLEGWKLYVGYEAITKGEEPSGKKFGRFGLY